VSETKNAAPRARGEKKQRADPRGEKATRNRSDEEALKLRDEGHSYAGVARSLNMKQANEAHAAFIRALRRRPEDEQERLVDRERSRLNRLEERIRDGDKEDPTLLDRRLAALARLRKAVS